MARQPPDLPVDSNQTMSPAECTLTAVAIIGTFAP